MSDLHGARRHAPRGGLIYTLAMRFITFVIFAALAITPQPALANPEELVTVPSEATAAVEKGDYAKARDDAVNEALASAARLAVAGITRPEDLESGMGLIEEKIVSHGADFVKSYKFLQDDIDPVAGAITVRLQVTLFLDSLRKEIKRAGLRQKRMDLPRMLIIIDERNENFLTSGSFLMLSSRSEEALTRFFRERGYHVADRKDALKAGLEAEVANAMKGDRKAFSKLGDSLEVDMIVFGKTRVDARPVKEGEFVETETGASLFKVPDGELVASPGQKASGVYSDVLAGSLETTDRASGALAKELADDVRRAWSESKGEADE